jgi:hypothetical protein
MTNAPERNEGIVRRWKTVLVLSGLFLAGFGVWQVLLGNIGNGVGMIIVPGVVTTVLLTLITRRGN